MNVIIRPAMPEDAEACGRIIYEAFKGIAEQLADLFIDDPAVFGVVAESGGRVVGREAPGEGRQFIETYPKTYEGSASWR